MRTVLLWAAVFVLFGWAMGASANEDSILTWEAPVVVTGVPAPEQYNAQRKDEACPQPDGKVWVDLASVPATKLTYTDPQVAEGMVVCYRVSASTLNRKGESDWSDRAEKTVPFVQRGVPVNLVVQ